MPSHDLAKRILIVGKHTQEYGYFVRLADLLNVEVHQTQSLREVQQLVEATAFDVIIFDTELLPSGAHEQITSIHSSAFYPEVLILQNQINSEEAALCVQAGAWGAIQYGASINMVKRTLLQIFQYQAERHRRFPENDLSHPGIIGSSPVLKRCFSKMMLASKGDVNVLVTGETGTGKELIATAIHDNSSRSGHPFVVVDCAALPENLVENLLFGHEKGAYTGAEHNREGLIEQAHGGTLFLDEIGELPLTVQTTFLRVLQQRMYRPIGGKQERKSDFRLIAATNKDLEDLVKEKRFREDLLFRLKSLVIIAPPLRDRVEDLEPLAVFQTERLCEQYGLKSKKFSSDFFDYISSYHWPGNVRELNQALERAVLNSNNNSVIYPRDLPDDIRAKIVRGVIAASDEGYPVPEQKDSLFHFVTMEKMPPLAQVRAASVKAVEYAYLAELLNRYRTNIADAIEVSGLSRSRFYTLLKTHKLSTKS